MACRSPYTLEQIEHVLEECKIKPLRQVAKETGIHYKNISRWKTEGIPSRSPTQSSLLSSLSDLLLKYGPDYSFHDYTREVSGASSFRKYWKSWTDFRNDAWKLCPYQVEYNRRHYIEVNDALFIGGSDFHYWPGWGESTAHRALVYFSKLLKPTHVILNGDVPDFPQITHHRPTAWKKIPTLDDEIAEVDIRVAEIEKATPGAERLWNFGNHCIRHDNRLAEKVPEYKDRPGMRLQHHFPKWKFQNAIRVNEFELEITHRYLGGELAVKNNVVKAGISFWTGHDHNRQLYRWKDLRGTRWGINPGMAADPWGPQFEYQENNPSNHESGLAVVTFKNGKMMPPELIEVMTNGRVWFRGKEHQV